MSRVKVVEEPCGPYRLVATVNGAARLTVHVLDELGPVGSDQIILGNADAREAFIAKHIPSDARPEGREAMLKLAVAADAARVSGAQENDSPASTLPWDEPEPCADEVDGAELLAELIAVIRRYVFLGKDEALVVAVWTIHTYCIDAADHTPYIHVHAPTKGCGKSTLLDVVAPLSARAFRVSSVSASFLFRTVDKYRATLCIDEVSSWLQGPNVQELRGLLLDGFQRNGRVGRVETASRGDSREFEPTTYSVFGAKMLSGIGRHLPDELLDRMIPVRLERATDEQRSGLSKLRARDYGAVAGRLRARAARWAVDHIDELRDAAPVFPDGLTGRQEDIWEPLFAIGEALGDEIAANLRGAAVRLRGNAALDLGEQILADVREVFDAAGPDAGFFASAHILESLTARDDRPWCEMPRTHRPLTEKAFADLVFRFGIRSSRPVKAQPRGYSRKAFEAAWGKYLSCTPLSGPSGPTGPSTEPRGPGGPRGPDEGVNQESRFVDPIAEEERLAIQEEAAL